MKRLKLIILCILMFAGGVYVYNKFSQEEQAIIHVDKKKEIKVNLKSKNALLVKQDTGEIVLSKHASDRISPASMTKIMTVYLAILHLDDVQQNVTIPSDIFLRLQNENASMAGFLPDEKVTIEDLLYGSLLSSGAEASETLAVAISGDEASFVKLMNEEAKKIGMKNTHYMNCTGLDEDQHYSSVEDIALLLRKALNNDTFQKIFHKKEYWMITNLHPEGMMVSSTLWTSMEQHGLSNTYIQGGKTGFTNAAGLCLASQGKVHDEFYIFVSAEADGDGESDPYHILDALNVYKKIAQEEV